MQRNTWKSAAFAFGASLTTLGGFVALPALAQDTTTPPAPANGPGPATQPPPAPGTALPAPTQPAPQTPGAAPATPPPNYKIQYNGLIDGYYLLQFNNPKDTTFINGRTYDVRNNSPALALAELNVFQNAHPGGLGFKATLTTGDNADINHFNLGGFNDLTSGQGEARYKNIQQLYGTYLIGSSGAGVDFGKFYTPFGYEVAESNANYNYSRSLVYNAEPVYHAGARIYSPSGVLGVKGLVATGYLTRSLYNTPTAGVGDDNGQLAYIGQLNYSAPSGKFTLITTDGGGEDKLRSVANIAPPGGTETKLFLSDNDFTYNFNASMLAGLNYAYLSASPSGGPKTNGNGYAVYFRQQMTPKTALALRLSGIVSHTEGTATTKAFSTRPYEVTATYEYKAAANFLTRAEYRHDNANQGGAQLFQGSNGQATRSNQDTVSVSGVFTF